MLSVVLALSSSVTWGVSDFIGGLSSRRLAVPLVLLVSQTVGCVMLLPLAMLHGPAPLDATRLALAAAASMSGLVGIAGLYRGMAVGSISIVAPISATGAAVPVVYGLVRGEQVGGLQAAGVAMALLGVVLAARAASDGGDQPKATLASGVGYALLAALGFGGFFVLLHEASASSDVLWASAIQRLTGVCITLLIVLVRRIPLNVAPPQLGMLALVGVLDTTANVLYGYASTSGLVSLAAMLSSLYPVVTVILARVVLRERMSRSQGTGVVLALAGVACITLQ